MPEFAQSLVECRIDRRRPRLDCHDADMQTRRLLCSRHERPRDRATDRSYQFSSSDNGWHVRLTGRGYLAWERAVLAITRQKVAGYHCFRRAAMTASGREAPPSGLGSIAVAVLEIG